jgi:putative FmdB family regulatory protein
MHRGEYTVDRDTRQPERTMPTYEYVCKQCGERFEVFQSFKARPLKTHQACGGPVNKVFHASGVVFKGPGFYATDNRSSSKAPSGSSSATETAPKSEAPTKASSAKTASTDSD